MDLAKLESLDIQQRLYAAEQEAILTSSLRRSLVLRGASGAVLGVGGLVTTAIPLMALSFLAIGVHVALVVICFFLLLVLPVGAGMYAFFRYNGEEPSRAFERRYLPTVLEPQARAFFLTHAGRREELIAEGEAYDEALSAFQLLPEKAEANEHAASVAENFCERRERLKKKLDAYLAEFAEATADERERVRRVEEAREARKRSRKKDLLADFALRVKKLKMMEDSLGALGGTVGTGMTVDLSPYVAVQSFRSELEAEREALVAQGFRPRRLPRRRARSKLLPAAV